MISDEDAYNYLVENEVTSSPIVRRLTENMVLWRIIVLFSAPEKQLKKSQ